MERGSAEWANEVVVVDSNLVTIRNPDDIPSFLKKMPGKIVGGVYAGLECFHGGARLPFVGVATGFG